jgi:hypothetical protein
LIGGHYKLSRSDWLGGFYEENCDGIDEDFSERLLFVNAWVEKGRSQAGFRDSREPHRKAEVPCGRSFSTSRFMSLTSKKRYGDRGMVLGRMRSIGVDKGLCGKYAKHYEGE